MKTKLLLLHLLTACSIGTALADQELDPEGKSQEETTIECNLEEIGDQTKKIKKD